MRDCSGGEYADVIKKNPDTESPHVWHGEKEKECTAKPQRAESVEACRDNGSQSVAAMSNSVRHFENRLVVIVEEGKSNAKLNKTTEDHHVKQQNKPTEDTHVKAIPRGSFPRDGRGKSACGAFDFQILNLKFEFFSMAVWRPIGTPSSNATFVVCPFLIFPFEAPA